MAPSSDDLLISGAGIGQFDGRGGDDTIRILGGSIATSQIQGGAGLDTLSIAGDSAVAAADLAGVLGIEIITLFSEGLTIELSQAMDDALPSGNMQVNGSDGEDTIDARLLSSGTVTKIFSGDGDDTVLGGAGHEDVSPGAASIH